MTNRAFDQLPLLNYSHIIILNVFGS